jgi:hypothetical protein
VPGQPQKVGDPVGGDLSVGGLVEELVATTTMPVMHSPHRRGRQLYGAGSAAAGQRPGTSGAPSQQHMRGLQQGEGEGVGGVASEEPQLEDQDLVM